MRAGRKIKTHTASYDSTVKIPGLSRCPDGRWRVMANGKETRFTEPNEQKAVARAQQLLGIDQKAATAIEIRLADIIPNPPDNLDELVETHSHRLTDFYIEVDATGNELANVEHEGELADLPFRINIPDKILWPWFRYVLTEKPEYVAKMTGLSETSLRQMALPRASIKLTKIIDNYMTHGPATDKAKAEALSPLNRLIELTGARTLDDLTTANMLLYRTEIEKRIAGPATRRAYYARIKSVIGFGLKTGMDTDQIRAALDRCKVLWTGEALPNVKPTPISREDFHSLLSAGSGTWRPWLLLGLNLCLHLGEVCQLKWAEFDLSKGTYAAIRNKTRRDRIPRAATLWPETTAALLAIERRGNSPYVFTSTHGKDYNRNTRGNDFAKLRALAGIKSRIVDGEEVNVTYDWIRDGAYTAACHAPGVDDKYAKLLAGHSAGLQDNYVLRNPACVKPACDAVFRAYGPFPIAKKS
jgi:integrase